MSRAADPTPKVLLVNFHSTMNAGDLGLLLCTREFLLRAFPSCEIKVSANWPEEPALRENGFTVVPSTFSLSGLNKGLSVFQQIQNFLITIAQLCNTNSKRLFSNPGVNQFRSSYNMADLVMSVPGNQFFSKGRFGWPFPVNIADILLAHRYHKPLIVLPQSIGPLNRWWEKALIRSGYGKARWIFLRDDYSLKLAESLGLPLEKVRFVPDLALGLHPANSDNAIEILKSYGVDLTRPTLGVTLISRMSRSLDCETICNYYEVIKTSLANFSCMFRIQLVFFNQVTGPMIEENDGIPTARIVTSLMQDGIEAIHIEEKFSPAMLKACYGQMDAFLATRLHSGIYATGMSVPTLFIGYLTKTRGVVKSLNLEDDFIDIKELSPDIVLSKLVSLWVNRHERNKSLDKVIRVARQKIEDTVGLLKEDCGNG